METKGHQPFLGTPILSQNQSDFKAHSLKSKAPGKRHTSWTAPLRKRGISQVKSNFLLLYISPLKKSGNMSSSDRFQLENQLGTNKNVFKQMEAKSKMLPLLDLSTSQPGMKMVPW